MESKSIDFEEEEEELDEENIQEKKDTNVEDNNSTNEEEEEEQEYFDIFTKDKNDDLNKNRKEYRNEKMKEEKLPKEEEGEEEDQEEREKEEQNIKYQEEEENDENDIKYKEKIKQLIKKIQKEIEKKDDDDQEKEDNDYIHKEEEKEQNDDSTNFLNVSSIESAKIKKLLEYSHESQNELIESFKTRIKMKSLKMSQIMQQTIVGSKPKSEEYWSKNYDKSLFKNGFFDFGQEKQLDLWNDAFTNCKATDLTKDETARKIMEFINNNSFPPYKIYKLFVYNDSEWQINVNDFNSLKSNLSQYQVKIPLVFLFDFNKKILKQLYSKLACPYKKDGLNQILVYALYSKPLKIVKGNFIKNNDESFNPIYLVLHVPKSKRENKSKINTIIYRIYYFLHAICDIEVVVLNEKYYNDQIHFVNKFNEIFLSYKDSIKSVNETKNDKHISIDKSDKSLSDDGDDVDENNINDNDSDDIDENNINDNDDDLINEIASKNNLDIFDKTLNCIFLANSNQIDGYCKRTDETKFFENLKNKIKESNCYFHFINVKKPSTYYDFITTLKQLFSNSNDCTNERTFEKLQLIELANISGYYIQCKLGINPKVSLKSMINTRFSQFKKYNYSFKSDLYLLTQLSNEIIKSCPPIDVEYKEKCNLIISGIKDELLKKYQNVIVDQLQISAEKSISYWEIKINERYHLSDEDRSNIRTCHGNFLKSEYFDIISKIFQPKEIPHAFNGNYSILTDQIKSDNLRFIDLFKEFDNKILNESDQQKIENIEDLRDKATNYMIREKENIREKIVTIESDKFDEIFESDF